MKIVGSAVIGFLLALLPSIAHAGDYSWWTIEHEGKAWGIGEMNDRILLYLGNTHWLMPFPYRDLLLVGGLVGLGLIAITMNPVAREVGFKRQKHEN